MLMDSHSWNLIVKAKTRCVLTLSNGFLWALFPPPLCLPVTTSAQHSLFISLLHSSSFFPSLPSSVIAFIFSLCGVIHLVSFFSLNLSCSRPQDDRQRITLVQLSPIKYCHRLIITSWKLQKTRNAAPVHLRVIIYFVNISQPHWKKVLCWIVTITGMTEALSPLNTNHWFMLHLFHF